MYVDIVISNIFNLNKHFFFCFLFFLSVHPLVRLMDIQILGGAARTKTLLHK